MVFFFILLASGLFLLFPLSLRLICSVFLPLQTLRKKGFNGCDSPEPDGEDSIDQSPLNDDKYRKTTEDLDVLFKRYGVSGWRRTVTTSLTSIDATGHVDIAASLVISYLKTSQCLMLLWFVVNLLLYNVG